MIHGDIFKVDFSQADILLINCTCFTMDMMEKLGTLQVKPGSFAITTTKNLEGDWEILECEKRAMSWAPATIFISRKF